MNKIKHLTNIKIIEKQDKNFDDYYIIFDQNTEREKKEAYFCFEQAIKENWSDLTNNWQEISEIEFEYEENEKGNRITSIYQIKKFGE